MFGSMFRRKFEYKVPGLNTTSTADISFIFLIFFLVTTSMDADKGITRELPPIDKNRRIRRLMWLTIRLSVCASTMPADYSAMVILWR